MASRVVKLIPNKTALFVCDIQEAFHPVMHAYPSVISTCTKMIKAAPLLSLPIIITEQNPSRLGKTVPLPREALEEMEKREKVLIVEKTKFSMMVEGVEEKLKEWGIESVIIFGIESHVCVLQTSLDLLSAGFSVHILADGVSSCNHAEVGIALTRLRESGCQITTSESALFQLMVDSKHPNFRAISALVKESKAATTEALNLLVVGSGGKL